MLTVLPGRGKPAFNPGVRRGGGPSQASGYQGRPRISPEKSKSAAWADPPNLITTQRQRELESKALDKKIREEHLTPLEEGADPYGVVSSLPLHRSDCSLLPRRLISSGEKVVAPQRTCSETALVALIILESHTRSASSLYSLAADYSRVPAYAFRYTR